VLSEFTFDCAQTGLLTEANEAITNDLLDQDSITNS